MVVHHHDHGKNEKSKLQEKFRSQGERMAPLWHWTHRARVHAK